MPFVVYDKRRKEYKGYGNRWTDQIALARIYKRTCDAKNSEHIQTGGNLEILKVELVPEKIKYEVVSSCNPPWPGNFIAREFNDKQEAENYIQECSLQFHLHTDYFKLIDRTSKPIHQRPNWQDYFLGLALVVSKRSHDIHTQHGCILVDSKTNHMLASGYNGFPRGMDDSSLPTNRPDPAKPDEDDKYAWMLHSEFNACCNMGAPADDYTVAYVTGEPCTPCLMHLWQKGVKRVIHRNAYGSKYLIDEKTRKRKDILLRQTGMQVIPVEADLSWLAAACLTK